MTVPPQARVTERAVVSASWLLTHRVVANVVRLAAIAVLARQLSPAQFGIVALAQVLLSFINLVGEAGIRTYLIYDGAEDRENRVNAAFWLNLAVTVVQCGLCLAVLPFVGRLFDQPQLTPVLGALIVVFFIRQMGIVPEALLERDLRHPLIAKRDILTSFLSAATSVVLAVAGAGVWSLVVPSLVFEPVRGLVAVVASRWRPRLPMQVSEWRRILRYTAPLMGSNVLIPVTNDGDTLVVGKLLGAATVGQYSLAWQLSNMIGRNVTAVVVAVTMPALALLRDDLDRLRAAYLRMIRFLGFTCFPLLTGMAVVAGDLVPAIYGPGWDPVVALLRIFVAFTLVRALTSPSSMVYNVTGRPGIGFRVTAWLTPAYLLAIFVGSQWGAIGIATSVVLVRTGGALVELRLAGREIDLRVREVARTLVPAAALTLVMACAVGIARVAMEHAGIALVPRLLLAIALGGAIYLSALTILRPAGYEDLSRSLRSTMRGFGRRLRSGRAPGEPPLVAGGPA